MSSFPHAPCPMPQSDLYILMKYIVYSNGKKIVQAIVTIVSDVK